MKSLRDCVFGDRDVDSDIHNFSWFMTKNMTMGRFYRFINRCFFSLNNWKEKSTDGRYHRQLLYNENLPRKNKNFLVFFSKTYSLSKYQMKYTNWYRENNTIDYIFYDKNARSVQQLLYHFFLSCLQTKKKKLCVIFLCSVGLISFLDWHSYCQ